MQLYQEELMDHYRYPRNRGTLENPDFNAGEYNPSCGDSIELQGNVISGTITTIKFQGKGCVISQAAASMLTLACIGKTVHAILALDKDFMPHLIGIQLGPTRLKCALLPLLALQTGVVQYESTYKEK